jgi:DNA-binding LytR/AlgR family response regulator
MATVYQCLIVDDEKPAHLVLQSHLSKFDDLAYAGSAYNGKEALKMLLENTYDIVFLDINMPLINGIEVMQTLAKRPATIVTTAYSEFAFESYQQDAIDYLLKPISLSRFLKAVEKAKVFCQSKTEKSSQKTTITLRLEGISRDYQLDNILYFESIGNYVKVHFVDNTKSIVVYESLKNIIENTPINTFIQSHKSFVVNVSQIETVEKDNVVLQNNVRIPLGRKYELMVSRMR